MVKLKPSIKQLLYTLCKLEPLKSLFWPSFLTRRKVKNRFFNFSNLSISLFLYLSFTVLCLVPEHAELLPWLSPILVLPVLQLLYCSGLTEPLLDKMTYRLNQDLTHSMLLRIRRETNKSKQVTTRLQIQYNTLIVKNISSLNKTQK